jgi:hypothetical protein
MHPATHDAPRALHSDTRILTVQATDDCLVSAWVNI